MRKLFKLKTWLIVCLLLLSLVTLTGCENAEAKLNDFKNQILEMFGKDPIIEITCEIDPTQEKCQQIEKTCVEDPTQEKCKPVIVGDITNTLSIHFLEVGNQYTGDAIYIKAGDVDILIDAGSRTNSARAICEYVDKYATDKKLEYVIATHAHQDHIAGFVGTSKIPGVFAYYECETIIDFPLTNSTTKVYENYVNLRDAEIALGAKHYTALECYKNENGASRVYQLTEDIEMEILYNYFYENTSSDENEYSVCVMLNHGDRHFLLTGDLEKDGEEKLVELNELPEVDLFKAGHHGSYTASNIALLEVIKPKNVVVTCCAGSTEYTSNNNNTFPSQDFVSRIAKYTDQVFVTSVANTTTIGYESMNGAITVTSGENLVITGSNNNTILKDTTWFSNNRVWE